MIKFQCTRCKANIQAPETVAGKHVACPTCQHKNTVPRAAAKKPIPKVVWAALAVMVLAALLLLWAFAGGSNGSDKTPVAPEAPPKDPVEIKAEERAQEARIVSQDRGMLHDQDRATISMQKADYERQQREEAEKGRIAREKHERQLQAEEYRRQLRERAIEEQKKRGEEPSVNPILD